MPVCKKCGEELENDSRICAKCGTRIRRAPETGTPDVDTLSEKTPDNVVDAVSKAFDDALDNEERQKYMYAELHAAEWLKRQAELEKSYAAQGESYAAQGESRTAQGESHAAQEESRAVQGESYAAQGESRTAQEDFAPKKKSRNTAASVVVIVAFLSVLIVSGSFFVKNITDRKSPGSRTVNLNSYIEISFSGYDKQGTASVAIKDKNAFRNEIAAAAKAYGSSGDYLAMADKICDSVRFKVTPDAGLSNGDKVTVTVSYDEAAAKEAGVILEFESFEVEVNSLKTDATAAALCGSRPASALCFFP